MNVQSMQGQTWDVRTEQPVSTLKAAISMTLLQLKDFVFLLFFDETVRETL